MQTKYEMNGNTYVVTNPNETIYYALDDIVVPKHYTLPSVNKISRCYAIYKETNKLNHNIVITTSGEMLNGYVAYLVAKLFNKDMIEVFVANQEKKPLTGYERAENGDYFLCVTCCDQIYTDIECRENQEKVTGEQYDSGNYYTNRKIAENNARADKLMRELRRWQALNDDVCDWCHDDDSGKWYIAYSYMDNVLYSDVDHYGRIANAIYFSTEEKADEAIAVFRDELMWYFTEYRQRLDEPERGEGER